MRKLIILLFFSYFIGINIYSYLQMKEDKRIAVENSQKPKKDREWRISEQDLYFLAVIGGAIGTELAIYDFPSGENKHKVSKASWRYGIVSLIVNHLFIILLFLNFMIKKQVGSV